MPAGFPYFAWIDVGETTFTAGHMRWDEDIFSFTLEQSEGDPANLTIAVRRPRNAAGDPVGLLCPGRKIWAWFAFDCGPALIKFRGRLVGIPTSLFEDLVTLEFVARPIDVVAQKAALADTLRVLPHYDEVMIEPARRNDPDVVLEGYTKIWHYDPETHIITVSDEINGEDGLVAFDGTSEDGKVLYDGLGLTLTSGPLSRVDVAAEFTWTQQARGGVDLTSYLYKNWPNNIIALNKDDWPKPGTGIGDGWEVAQSNAVELYDFTVYTHTRGGTVNVDWTWTLGGGNAGSSSTTTSETIGTINFPATVIGWKLNSDTINVSYAKDPDGLMYTSSYNRNYSTTTTVLGMQVIRASLAAGYNAQRQCTERVTFTIFADVQSILSDPEDGEALRIDNIHSVNLSESINGGMPIGDARRRSYIATERGNQSLEHLIALARAHLMKRARVVEITFAPKLARMSEITLRKNVSLIEPRVGEAIGKIIGYSLALDGSDGQVKCEVRMGCTIGRGGATTITDGTPTYCTIDYAGYDYQQFIGRTVLFDGSDTSVGYQPPNADPNDDGINFMSSLSTNDVIEVGLGVTYGPEDNSEPVSSVTAAYETRARFKLKSMRREFSTDYDIQVTDLKVPTGYNLEVC